MAGKMITLICYWNRRMINGRKGVSYEGPPPTAIIIRSQATFEEFIDKIYQVTGYDSRTHV